MNRFLLTTGFMFLAQLVLAQEFIEMSVNEEKFNVPSAKGIAIADYDNDGDDDFLITTSFDNVSIRLFRNDGDWIFTDVTESSGIEFFAQSKNAIWFDANSDGLLDLYISNANFRDQLFKNNGDGTFQNITESTGIINLNYPTSVLCGDLNGDLLPDIYVTNFQIQNQLWINKGNFEFENKTIGSGAESRGKDMGAVLYDYDFDGDQDIYITYDGKEPNKLLQNDGSGNFTDLAPSMGLDYEGFGMGADFADFNHDGTYDLYITNLFDNTLYQSFDNTFENISISSGTNDYGMTWGVVNFDFNNDSYSDVYIVNEYGFSPYSNILYKNEGNGIFSNVSEGTPLQSDYNGFGGATGDFNHDGNLDLVVANSTDPGVQIFQNQTNTGNYVTFTLIDQSPNVFAIGARVEVLVGDSWLIDQVTTGSGYISQNSYNLHFGTADESIIEQVRVNWPNGDVQQFYNIQANARYLIGHSEELTEFNPENYQEAISRNASETFTITKTNFESDRIILAPNPSIADLFLTGSNINQIEIFNSKGHQLHVSYSHEDGRIRLNTRDLTPGIYQIILDTNQGRLVKRVIME